MIVTIGSRIVLTGCTPSEVAQVAHRWEVANPEHIAAARAGRWCGCIPPTINAAEVRGASVRLPRGLLYEVARLFQEAEVQDCTEAVVVKAGPPPVVTLRDYQTEAVAACMASDQGYVVAPCGAGKTTMALEVIRRRAQSALVLVHTRGLLDQWRAAIHAQLGVWGVDNVQVATVQSLWGTKARAAKPLPPHGLLLVDEAHHQPSRCFNEVVARSTARYRYGVTATPDREDGLGCLLGWTFGERLYTVDRSELFEDGHMVRPRVDVIQTGCKPETTTRWNRATREDVLDWNGIVQQLVDYPARLALVADLAETDAAAGHVVLVLTQRVEHAKAIGEVLWSRGVQAHVVTGTMGTKAREAALSDVRDGRVRVLIATQLADEGLDLPILDRCILALPSRAEGRTIQRVGRIMRPAPGKGEPVLYDLADDHPACWSQRSKRRKALAEACGRS